MSMDPVLHSYRYANDFLREQVADVADADLVAQPRGAPNHAAWVIGHLTLSSQMLAGVIGVRPWLPPEYAARFGSGSAPVADVRAYAPRERALAALADAEARIVAAVAGLDEARLDAPFPNPAYLAVFPTVRHALTQVLVGHSAHHVGQVGAWRKALGMPAMPRSFE